MHEVTVFTGAAAEWDDFVTKHSRGTAAHLYAWRRVIRGVYGHDCPYLVSRSSGVITGVLPLVDVRSLAFGRYLVSMPYLNAGGPLGAADASAALTRAATDLARQRGSRLLEFRCLEPMNGTAHTPAEKVSCVLELGETAELQWSALGSKLRSQIRRPQKEGIEVRFGADQAEPFFHVFARNMRDLGTPTHPPRFFRAIRDELRERAWFGCAYLGDRPVAGGCALLWGDEIEMMWASALREFSARAPNMLLYWSFIERAVTTGLRRFNFGRCTPGSGSHKFKLQWGAADTPLPWYRWPEHAQSAAPRQDQGSMAIATRIWRRMPMPVANLLGANLRGGIPS